jgi:hypothetical protein
MVAGGYPFPSLISSICDALGLFVLIIALCIHLTPLTQSSVTPERAFIDFLFSLTLLFWFVWNIMIQRPRPHLCTHIGIAMESDFRPFECGRWWIIRPSVAISCVRGRFCSGVSGTLWPEDPFRVPAIPFH